MPTPRKALVNLEVTPFYHCSVRCVRRAFLCGEDAESGRSFEHRRGWIRERLLELAALFALDICAYAVMSNHYHLVVRMEPEAAAQWTALEVIHRWHGLFSGTPLSRRFEQGEQLSEAERLVLDGLVILWRSRLTDLSWFMRAMNEQIARRANAEDGCTGRFWEGRFKSQALLDEKAILACMAYVDLNPIRAQLAKTPEESHYTSVRERITTAIAAPTPELPEQQPPHLLPFVGDLRLEMPKGLPFRLADYLELVEFTGRILREGKRGAISHQLPPILQRLGIEQEQWHYLTTRFESPFKGLVGAAHRLKAAYQALGYRRIPGVAACRRCFSA